MIRSCFAIAALAACCLSTQAYSAEPLRVFIRSGPKSHGPGAHDYPAFLRDWVPLLNERGLKAEGKEGFPTREELARTDVLILHAQEAGNIKIGQERKDLMEYLQRGGGLVVIHAAAVSRDHDWFKTVIGGSWHFGQTKWLEGPMHLYFTDRENPITKDCSNWAMEDEIYYDFDMLPEARVLAGAYTPKPAGARNEQFAKRAEELTGGGKKVSIYDIQPQLWTYEKDNYRAFVSLPGHFYKNFSRPNYRAILLRGIAWAGKRPNVDEFLRPEEMGENLRYVEGGPVRPEKAHEQLEVHPEFDITLVAAEPLINKPMNLDWDPKGRLWVCETPEYPNGRREQNVEKWKDSGSYSQTTERDPIDRIAILSDTDGDGRMDKKHVFADKLELVTSFCFFKNGVIACSAPDIWFLEDTNGDEVADKRTKLYTGLGINDTHAVINNLRWGLDGWVYATHGYSAGDVTCLGEGGPKEPARIGSGVVRFKPDGTAIEMYSSRNGNTWGLDITARGDVFWTQPTSGTVFFHTVLPEHILARGKVPGTNSWKGMITGQKSYPLLTWPEQAYVQIDQVGNFTAAAGCAVYEGGAWPDQWHYSYFTTEPTINLVHHQFVRPEGVSYTTEKEKGREETEFIRGKDLWFRPIETRVGPDGALYVVDFYNQAVIHNDTRGPVHGPANAAVRPDRDHYFGRIWKVQHKQAKKLDVVSLDGAGTEALDETAKTAVNAHVQKQALRLRSEKEQAQSTRWRTTDRMLPPRFKPLAADETMPPQMLYDFLTREKRQTVPATGAMRPILDAFEKARDDWSRSACIAAAVATNQEFNVISQALHSSNPAAFTTLVEALLPAATDTEKLVQRCAEVGEQANVLKLLILRRLAQNANAPAASPALTESLKTLLSNQATAGAALPLAMRVGGDGPLAAEVRGVLGRLQQTAASAGAPVGARIAAAEALIRAGGEAQKGGAQPLLDATAPPKLQAAIIQALDEQNLPGVLLTSFEKLRPAQQQAAFDAILKRPESTLALLDAVRSGAITPGTLGPVNAARLRTHPNKNVARQAAVLLDKLNPQTALKNELIAKLTPQVEKPGDAANGKMLFTAACSICHKLGDVGLRDVGPPLAGMGAHGPAELLAHIVDPNREVDPSFWQWNITTKKGETLVGIIASENAAGLTLRSQTGDVELKLADIAKRENTRRSLMPEGLEGLGADALRDILTFICGGEQKYRVVDLRGAYTADSRRGIFRSEESKNETITLHRFGNVMVKGVPFFVMDPAKSPNGGSIIALKGGGKGTVATEFPRRIVIPTHATAASLHFLGGVGGWAWPFGGEDAKGKPAMKLVVDFADGDSETFVLKNGEHFADYIGRADVPLSENAGDFTRRGQLRYFALNLKKTAPLKQVVLESFDNGITPCTVAMTAGAEKANVETLATPAAPAPASEANPKEGGKGDRPLAPAKPVTWQPNKKRILIIGGGSAHDFAKFFGEADTAILTAAGFSPHYTEDRDQAATALAEADAAVISVNRKFFDTPAYRKALMDFAAAGKGIVMLHPGTWYGYTGWPELNARIVGGGARGHDKIHPFEVNALRPEHPVMKDMPATFTVEDELYYMNAGPVPPPSGTAPITVLAETSPSEKFGMPHPSVWVTEHPSARIVGIALGHDQRTHDHPAFRRLLANAVGWVAEGGQP